MNDLIHAIDPETYGIRRGPIALGVCAAVFMTVIGSKLLAILHEAGLPSVG